MKKKSTARVQMLQHWLSVDSSLDTHAKGLEYERKDTKETGFRLIFIGTVMFLALAPILIGWIDYHNMVIQTLMALLSAGTICTGIALMFSVKDIDYMLEAESEIEDMREELKKTRAESNSTGEAQYG